MAPDKTLALTGAISKVSKEMSTLDGEMVISNNGFIKNVRETSKYSAKNEIKNWIPKDKHMQGTNAKNAAQFNTNDISIIRDLVKEALESPQSKIYPNSDVNRNSHRIVYDAQRPIGTKGQTRIRVIIGGDGKIWNAFPVNDK